MGRLLHPGRIGVLGLLILGLFFCRPISTAADETGSEAAVIYTTKEMKPTLYMLPTEVRMLSLQSGNSIRYESEDPSVVAINGYGQMHAVAPGKARVIMYEGNLKKIYTVVVRDTVDIIVFAGQSNMAGAGGWSSGAPVPTKGTAYEFNLVSEDNRKLVPLQEPFGNGTNKSHIVNGKFVSGNGTLSSAFAIAYYKQTKVPIVGIPAAWGGTSSRQWLKDGLLSATLKRMKKAKKYLKQNKIKIRHIYVVWYQGESDGQYAVTAESYIKNMKKIWKKFKKSGAEKIFMIKIAQQVDMLGQNDTIQGAQEKLCKTNKNFIMATKAPASMHENFFKWYSDVVHINQKGLNRIGKLAGKKAGKYAKSHSGN